ncbi:MAG: hypothetical protein ABI042_19290 [Verrucomicrobiota bacterium]
MKINVPTLPDEKFLRSHQWMDACSLEMCRVIAGKIQRQPELMHIARKNLKRWKKIRRPCPQAVKEWDSILKNNDPERILEILTQDNDTGQRLRQGDPFVGILTETERLQILRAFKFIE